MPKKIISLNDLKVKNAKPSEKPVKYFDGGGLFLLLTPSGGKLWKLKYRFGGVEKTLSLGAYPQVSLSDAREKRSKARRKIDTGIDPAEEKKAVMAEKAEISENTFQNIALEWHSKRYDTWTRGHAETIKRRLERDVFPLIGHRPIKGIKASDIINVLRIIESRGAIETAHRIKIVCSQIFRYARASDKTDTDPTIDINGFIQPAKVKHRAAIIEPEGIAGLLRSIDGYEGTFIVKCALQLAPLIFVRPGELRSAEWTEIDFKSALWTIPAERMKMRTSHIVPLSCQTIEILKSLHPFTRNSKYVFPSSRSPLRPMSNNAILSALRRMGFEKDEMSGHGFRAMARTILDEVLQFRPDFIEHQLAHAVRDPNGRAYNRTSHIEERKKMMQVWADYLDGLKAGAKVIPLKRTGTNI
jgi:integrase